MNEVGLSRELKQIEFEINYHKKIAGQSVWEIGRRLNHVKENNLAHGEFISWVESIGMSQTQAKRFMTVAKKLNRPTSDDLGLNALYMIATLPEKEREKEHVTTKGETKKPDEMTVRELQDLKKKLKDAEEKAKNAEEKEKMARKSEEIALRKLEDAEEKEPAVVERIVEKEVFPSDYSDLKSNHEQLLKELENAQAQARAAYERNNFIEGQYRSILERESESREKAKKLEQLEQDMEELAEKKDRFARQTTSIKNFIKFKNNVDDLLIQISPLIYQDDIEAIEQSDVIRSNYEDIVDKVQKWCDDMYRKLDRVKTIEGEIIND